MGYVSHELRLCSIHNCYVSRILIRTYHVSISIYLLWSNMSVCLSTYLSILSVNVSIHSICTSLYPIKLYLSASISINLSLPIYSKLSNHPFNISSLFLVWLILTIRFSKTMGENTWLDHWPIHPSCSFRFSTKVFCGRLSAYAKPRLLYKRTRSACGSCSKRSNSSKMCSARDRSSSLWSGMPRSAHLTG